MSGVTVGNEFFDSASSWIARYRNASNNAVSFPGSGDKNVDGENITVDNGARSNSAVVIRLPSAPITRTADGTPETIDNVLAFGDVSTTGVGSIGLQMTIEGFSKEMELNGDTFDIHHTYKLSGSATGSGSPDSAQPGFVATDDLEDVLSRMQSSGEGLGSGGSWSLRGKAASGNFEMFPDGTHSGGGTLFQRTINAQFAEIEDLGTGLRRRKLIISGFLDRTDDDRYWWWLEGQYNGNRMILINLNSPIVMLAATDTLAERSIMQVFDIYTRDVKLGTLST